MKSLIYFMIIFACGYFVGQKTTAKTIPEFIKEQKKVGITFKNKIEKVFKEKLRKPATQNKFKVSDKWFYLKKTSHDDFNSIDNARCLVNRVSVRDKTKVYLNLFCQGSESNQTILRKQIISKYKN